MLSQVFIKHVVRLSHSQYRISNLLLRLAIMSRGTLKLNSNPMTIKRSKSSPSPTAQQKLGHNYRPNHVQYARDSLQNAIGYWKLRPQDISAPDRAKVGTLRPGAWRRGWISVFIPLPPKKSAQVNFLWGKNDVRTAIQQFYTPQKNFFYTPKANFWLRPCLMYGGIFNYDFIAYLLLSVPVKEL